VASITLIGAKSRGVTPRVKRIDLYKCGFFVLELVVHIQTLIRDEDDFAVPILILEGLAISALLATLLAIVFVVQFVRKDDAYSTQLRRNDVSARYPFDSNGAEVAGQLVSVHFVYVGNWCQFILFV
jgi:hypothetical protein